MGVSEFPVKKNHPESNGGRDRDRISFEMGGKLCSGCFGELERMPNNGKKRCDESLSVQMTLELRLYSGVN